MRKAAKAALSLGLLAVTLPASGATAEETAPGGTLGGFSARAIGAPIRVEIWEPLIPIPAEPQAEIDIAYTKAIATTGPAGKGRASWLWPGDPAGEGFETFAQQLQLPKQVGENGYVVQVNSEYPGDNGSTADEPVPGMVMRTSADAETTVAKAGFSPMSDLEDGDAKKEDKDSGGAGGGEPPELPSLPPGSVSTAAEDPKPPLGDLAPLVTAGAMDSVSKTTYGTDTVVASAVTHITDLSLLDGVITAESVKVLSRTTSTLSSSENVNDVTVTGLAIGGVPFGITEDGVVVGGEGQEIPGLSDVPAEALAELGIGFTLPTATKSVDGGSGEQEVRGLQVAIDFSALRSRWDSGPVDGIIAGLPEQLDDLKGPLGALTQGQPRVVIVLGEALTEASTVAPIDYEPPVTPTDQGEEPAGDGGSDSAGGGAGTTGGPASEAPVDSGSAEDGVIAGPVEETTDVAVQPMGSGLPPLGSVPGALLVGGLMLAGALGWWIQRMGGLVLGGASSCQHGLASGVPDLRKA